MVFNSLYFLLVFLPLALLLYYVTPQKLKNMILVLISFVFYAWGEPQYLLVLLFSIVFNFRGYDTLGESFILIGALAGCLVILRKTGKKAAPETEGKEVTAK